MPPQQGEALAGLVGEAFELGAHGGFPGLTQVEAAM
jgi:hypothetical protein